MYSGQYQISQLEPRLPSPGMVPPSHPTMSPSQIGHSTFPLLIPPPQSLSPTRAHTISIQVPGDGSTLCPETAKQESRMSTRARLS
jgi:hypothetical protein